MSFDQKEAEALLVDAGRMCCLCGKLHSVQLHHIVPKEDGGTDDIDNAIPLCPNCHDEVHGRTASGRTTRTYSASELKAHRQRTVETVRKRGAWSPGSPTWDADRDLVLFYAQCLDRPAFHTNFHKETSFSAFDKAMEDTLLALNTDYWRTRDGAVIERSRGKSNVVDAQWREKLDTIAQIIEEIRRRFHEAVGFNRALYNLRRETYGREPWLGDMPFRRDRDLGQWMDEQRQRAIELMNSMLTEIGHRPLRGIHGW